MRLISRLGLLTLVGILILSLWSMVVWPSLAHGYAQILISVLQPLMTNGTELRLEANAINVYDSHGTAIVRKNLSSLNEFGLLLALFLAAPIMPFLQRTRRLLVALGIQTLLHILEIALLIWIAYEFYFGINRHSFAYWLLNLLMAGNLIFPILIWALLTWRSWLPTPQPIRRPTKEAHL
ncbi:MAG: hypothetical protein K6T71_00130 [Candidatus Bipolaricaulota bacterium]|nr:hypothetical protein [Candidatus Bipolaricaulota bacterium]